MSYIKINQEKVNESVAKELQELCPFNAFDYTDQYLSINAACKLCKICVKNGPHQVCDFIEDQKVLIDKDKYNGIVVYIQHRNNTIHPVSFELIGKALKLAQISKETVHAVLIGQDVNNLANEVLSYGVNSVFVYDDKRYETFNVIQTTDIIETLFHEKQFNILLFGGTPHGRSLAPRVAARLKTGLTADCTKLDITPEGDLLQIRPAFGGNIMAKIHTPNHRPQLATARYKIFDEPNKVTQIGTVEQCIYDKKHKPTLIDIITSFDRPEVSDISDAEIIIAVGRAFKKKEDLELVKPLQKALHAELACTRPLIENGWFDPRRQIGLSGRTVKPKLLINLGISGAVQYIEGMKEADLIISINSDKDNPLFQISHYAIQGDIYEVLPKLNKQLGGTS